MLKITRLKSASRSGDYYGKDDYYVTGEANRPGLMWGGKGAENLGLQGEVEAFDFKKLLQGLNPDRTGPALSKADQFQRNLAEGSDQSGHRNPPKHAPGWDMTFSAPKSFSVMALVAGDDRLQDLHNRSVQRAMDYAEKHFSITRNREKGGAVKETITGNLVYATTEHGMSRAGDPAMHNHVVVMNMTKAGNGKWQALETSHLYDHQNFLGRIYQAELQNGAKALGYHVVQGKTDGTWEIAEFSQSKTEKGLDRSAGPAPHLLEAFSQRHALIEKRIEAATKAKGKDLTPAERQTIILKDRPKKLGTPREQIVSHWQSVAQEMGVDLNQIRADAEGRDRGQDFTAQRVGHISLLGKALGFIEEKFLGRPRDVSPTASLAAGLRNQENRSTIFTAHDVIADAMKYNGNLHTIDAYLRTGFFARGDLLKADRQRLEHITTQRAIELENTLVDRIARSPDRSTAFERNEIDKVIYGLVSEGKALAPNTDQAGVVAHVLSDGRRYSLIHGSAGTGKTTTFDLLRQTLGNVSAGTRELVAIAPTHKARDELADRGGMSAETVQMFLIKNHAGSDSANITPEASKLRGKWLLVDEASMLSNDDMKRIVDVAEKAGIDKIILSFDERQLAAMEAGAPARLAMHSGASTAHLKDNIRQNQMPVLREGIMKMADGKTFDALHSMLPYIHETGTAADDALAAAAVKAWDRMGQDAKIIVATNKMRGLISSMVRGRLQDEGIVGPEDLEHKIYVSESKSKTDLAMIASYTVGQKIIFHQADRENRIGKHTVHDVVGIDRRNNRIELKSDEYGTRSMSLSALARGEGEAKFGIYREHTIKLSVGDQMAWNITDRKKDITNNSEFTITDIKNREITIEQSVERDGEKSLQRQVLNLDRDHAAHFMSHAYAITANRAQGQSYNRAIAVMGSNMGEFANHARGYVMSSRPKEDFQWITNDVKALFRQMAANDGINPIALDNIEKGVQIELKKLKAEKDLEKNGKIAELNAAPLQFERTEKADPPADTKSDQKEPELQKEKQITLQEISFNP